MEPVALLEQYFKCLESGDFAGAAICFSESARYSHPPYADDPPAAGRHEAHGREEILALFHRRGLRTTRHVIDTVARSGARFFISGVVHEAGGSCGCLVPVRGVVRPGHRHVHRVRRVLLPTSRLA